MKDFNNEKIEFYRQFDEFYSKPFRSCESEERELVILTADSKDCFEKRAISYKYLAENFEIQVLPVCPFAFHYNNRSGRHDMEMKGLSSWYSRLDEAKEVEREFYSNIAGTGESGLSCYYLPVDNAHLTVDYDKVLKKGFAGILKEVETHLCDPDKQTFYTAMKCGLEAYIRLAERFSIAASEMASGCTGDDKARMTVLADSMRRAPAEPARTFHEALNTIVFLYFTVPAIDAGTLSVFGHVDRLLCEYLRNDLDNGTITYEQAFDLIWRFIYIIDSRWTVNHMGTNCTITLGGCDQDGVPVFNDVTKLVITAYRKLRCIDPKLNIRITHNSPRELITLIAEAINDSLNNICVFNDDVIIEANRKMGKELRDCRLYVGGGCQENVIGHCEQNSRATLYMNTLPALFSVWNDSSWDYFVNRFVGGDLHHYDSNDDFEQIYQKTLHNLRVHITAQVNMKNISEAKGAAWCASPAHSALLGDCIEKGLDMYSGGTKYSSGSVSLVGIGTLIDSLLALKWVVFDKKLMAFDDFTEIVKNNFKGNEQLRRQIINEAPKYMRDTETNDFAARVFSDAAAASDGLVNTRGGKYEASLFSFRTFVSLGYNFPATPDGRLSGEHLSAGMSPTVLTQIPLTDVFAGLEKIDFTDYPVVAVLDIKLPPVSVQITDSIIRQFQYCGGSVLQINMIDQQTLIDAKNHPENHGGLIVRMSGYSARFVALSEAEKDEVINRAVN